MFAVALKYFAVILLILFHFNSRNSIFVCGEDGRQNASSLSRSTATTINGKRQSMIPLRETNDYDQKGGYSDDDDGDDEYDYDSYTESNSNDANENDVHRMANNDPTKSQSTESHRNFIFPMSADGGPNVKPKFLLSTLLPPTMPPTRSRSSWTAQEPSTFELCPQECSCLNDFMDCFHSELNWLPHVPPWIQRLELSKNLFNDENCEQNIRNLSNLIDLKLNSNKLTRMPIFNGLTSLQTLELANNEIRELSNDALLAVPKLLHLDLSRNLIHSIMPNGFFVGNSLQKLNLNSNRISRMDRRSFESLLHLNELKLNHNRIASIPTGLFTNLKNLKKLSLSNNQLQNNLLHGTFSNLTSLTSLKLRSNSITELITGVFRGLVKLSILDLSSNHLSQINKDGLLNMTALTKLNLANNTIHTIGRNCWEFTQKITHLDLSSNRLTEITANSLDMLTKLRELNLRRNQISTITSGAFNTTNRLYALDLGDNSISWPIEDSFGPFSPLQLLQTFNLNNNQIKTINQNAFIGLESLVYLDLRNNNISSIHDGSFSIRKTPALKELHMNSSELICDCNLEGFYRWVKEIKAIEKNGMQVNVKCAYPSELRGMSLLDLPLNNLTCHETPKPRLIDEPKSPELAIKGTNLTLECTVVLTSDSSDIEFKWKHDNVDISNEFVEMKFRKRDETRKQIHERLLERRRKANRSPIQVNVSAPKVPLASSSVSKLKPIVSDDDEEDEDDDEEDEEIEVDDTLDLGTDSDNENSSIDELIEQENMTNIPANSTFVSSILHLRNVDRKHAGRYQCIASNKFGSTYSRRFRVSVASFPVFTKRPSDVTVNSSKTVRLECAVQSDPKPTMYWQFNFGNDFPAARERRMHVMPGDEVFFITDAKLSDQGVYTCTAANSAGIIRANATVVIHEAPSLAKPMENKDAIIGESSVIECMKSGSPPPQIRWFKDNEPIEATDRHFLTADDQLLIIVKTTENDSGEYRCELENILGRINASMQLSVRSMFSVANENGYVKGINMDEMTAIVIITVVCCAIGTSIVWVVIIYQTKRDGGCTSSSEGGATTGTNRINSMTHSFDKDNNLLMTAANISMLPKGGDQTTSVMLPMLQPMRTATILNGRGVTRSSSSSNSSCAGHSSLGVSDDIFRHYKDDCSNSNTPLHRNNRCDSDEDDANNDNEALLGTTYCSPMRYSIDHIDGVEPNDSHSQSNSQLDTEIGGNTTTAECSDGIDATSPQKIKATASLSSSCHSIPPLPYHATLDFDTDSNASTSASTKNENTSIDGRSVNGKPVIAPVPIVGRTKPTIKTNKLNQLMATFKK